MAFEHVEPRTNQVRGNSLWFLPQPSYPTAPHNMHKAQHPVRASVAAREQKLYSLGGRRGNQSQESTCLIGDKVVKLIGAGRRLFVLDRLHIVQLAIRICGEKTWPQQATQSCPEGYEVEVQCLTRTPKKEHF